MQTYLLLAIFKRLLPLASEFNIRIVALSRRGFPGSTPLSPTERERFLTDDDHAQTFTSVTSEEFKTEFLNLRGVEILQFIDGFIKHSCIPSIQNIPHSDSEHGQAASTGGLSLTGWSLGCAFTLAAISNVDSPLISEAMRGRLGQYLRAHIMLGISRPLRSLSVSCDYYRLVCRTCSHDARTTVSGCSLASFPRPQYPPRISGTTLSSFGYGLF